MKGRNKVISFLLAFALLVTSVPNEWVQRVPEAKAAGEGMQSVTVAPNQLVYWDTSIAEENDQLNADATVRTTKIEYKTLSYGSYTTLPLGSSQYERNDGKVREAFGVSTGTVSSATFVYQWYEETAGKRVELEDETNSSLSSATVGTVNNAAKERTFVCKATLNSVLIGGSTYYTNQDMDNPDAYGISFERKYVLEYTGKVVQKSEIGDYFTGVDSVKNVTIRAHHKNDCYRYDDYLMNVSEIGRNDSNAYFNYTWTAHLRGGKTKAQDENTVVLDSAEHRSSLSSAQRMDGCQFLNVDGEEKQVDYYECSVDLCYGYQVVDTVSKKYYFRYEPFYINGGGTSEETIEIRKNGTAQMEVKARLADTEAVVPDSLTYQWYRLDADGNETKLNGETASSYTVRVPDLSVSYRVDVTAEGKEGFEGPEYDKVLSRTFRFTASDGYLLKDISSSYASVSIGEAKKLYVRPQVDNEYTLSYQWDRLTYAKDEKGNYLNEEDQPIDAWGYLLDADGEPVYDGSRYDRKVMTEDLGTKNECEVKTAKESDFEYITDSDAGSENTFYSSFNYRATVTVKKGEEVVQTHVYTFWITEDTYCTVTDQSQASLLLDPGDDLELYVKTEEKEGFTQEKIWYEKVGEGPAIETADVETGKTKLVSADSEFEIPGDYDWAEQGSFIRSEWDDDAGRYVYTYNYTFWKKMGEGDTYTKKGKNGSEIADVRGTYRYRLRLYRNGVEKEDDNIVRERKFEFTASYFSDLSAYAKSRFPSVKEGEKAKLRIVAQTRRDTYKIQYKWEKRQNNGTWKVIDDATEATYEISKASTEDAGQYRVTVSDEYGTELAPISIYLSVREEEKQDTSEDVTDICFTPESSTYHMGMNQNVKLKLDMKLSDKNAEVFYAWYRDEKIREDGSFQETEPNWELIGEDKDTYSLTIGDEDDFTTYKCLAVYRKNATEYAKREIYFHVKQAYSAELEKMTPASQIKKRGDSATYTVRLITDDPALAVNYQWYKGDGTKIEGATKETYQIASLEKGDFGDIYCVATDKNTEERVADRAWFTTRVYRNGAYLKTNNDEVEAEVGDAQTVLGPPEIVRKDGLELTYQWYRCRYGEQNDNYGETIIYGATNETLTIDEIGDNEFIRYKCRVFAEGDYLADYYTTVVEKKEEDKEEEKEPIEVSVREGFETNVKAFLGSSAKFAVDAVSNKGLGLKYQWYFTQYSNEDGEAIGGATESEYEVSIVTSRKTGIYYCVVMDEEGNRARSDKFYLTTTTGLEVETEGMNPSDVIGVQTSFGAQNLVLTATATASAEHGYTPFFQWYYETVDEKGLIYGANSQELVIPSIDEDALGIYYCVVMDSSGQYYRLGFYVYVNDALNVVPSTYHVLSQADGSAKMYVTATANAGCAISYQWSKWGKDEETGTNRYMDIEGATMDVLSISPLTSEDYGSYRCVISTAGEKKNYYFSLQPSYDASADRSFARQGDVVTVTAELENPASDYTYSYQWYEQETVTGTYRKIKGGTGAVCSKMAPAVDLSEQYTGNHEDGYGENGYVPVNYRCVITISDGEDKWTKRVDAGIRVLPAFAYQTLTYPETNHPNDKSFDLQAYQAGGAEALKVTFDAQTDLGDTAQLYLIDRSGDFELYGGKELAGNTITVPGDSVVFLMNGNRKANAYGYKVAAIEHVVTPQPGAAGQPGAGTLAGGQQSGTRDGAVTAAAKAKGKKYTIKNLVYKVTNTSGKKKAVSVVGVKSKKVKSIRIPATVKIAGAKYKVTAIGSKAFQNCAKLKTVTIGKNVTKIGASAFAKDKKLTKLTVKGTSLKNVGKKAFTKVPKKAKIKVPKKSKKAYKKLFRKGAFKGKVK